MSEAYVVGSTYLTVKGTVLRYTAGTANGLAADSSGLRKRAGSYDNIFVDITDAIDPARGDSHWVTVGTLVSPDVAAGATSTSNEFYIGTVALRPFEVFGVTNGQPAYLELAYNPITGEGRFYSNGILVKTAAVGGLSPKVIRIGMGASSNQAFTHKDIYVGRFEGNEEPRLRRWKSTTLPVVSNGIGNEVIVCDGTLKSVGATKLDNTYAIPAGTLAVVAQSTMLSTDNLADLVATITDGTKTSTVRSTSMDNILAQLNPSKGHGVCVGQLAPTPGATVLTVGVKAVDRA
jgi:hypothetical protein